MNFTIFDKPENTNFITFAVFNVSEYEEGYGPSRELFGNITWPSICHYIAYRNPPNSTDKYEINLQFWHVFTARLAFILIFEVCMYVHVEARASVSVFTA